MTTINTPAGPADEPPALSPEDVAYLRRTFVYHPPTGDQGDRYALIRAHAHTLATAILLSCPPSRERSVALTNLETAVMWANASIAREGK